ncbi:hypothetical protein ACH47B_15840 [Rhodococcus sp. NPDC019627]|uniref:hypothetical protein n=1 Tax=unclassified Rhodococcus (in: high G+C Gram-positive bacteria) TaxID=192944 RepID=UPI0033C48A9B
MSNTLRLEDDAIEKCVGVCDTMLEQIDDAIKKASRLARVSGFGGFNSAIELQEGYQRKFTGDESSGSVRSRLYEFRDAVMQMRNTFAAGGAAFADADSEIGKILNAIEGTE